MGIAMCTLSIWSGRPHRCQWCDDLLKGKQRRWCSPTCSKEFWDNHSWHEARAKAKRRDKYRCVVCGLGRKDGIKLEVNHKKPCLGAHRHTSCSHHVDGLETLCVECHRKATAKQRADGMFPKRKRRKSRR